MCKATADHYYLDVGKNVSRSLQTYARVPCGFAAVSDVRTNKHDDTMDSFVLSETFKYLYLLFAESSDLLLDLDEFIFTTEGHLLPLTLASIKSNATKNFEKEEFLVDETDRTCPNSLNLFSSSLRQPLSKIVKDVCPKGETYINSYNLQNTNLENIKIISNMGITFIKLGDGSAQLLQSILNANSPQNAKESLLLMQNIMELSQDQSSKLQISPLVVSFTNPMYEPPLTVKILAAPAYFGKTLEEKDDLVGGDIYQSSRIGVYTTKFCIGFLQNISAFSRRQAL